MLLDTLCLKLNSENHNKKFYLSLRLKSQGLHLNFETLLGLFHILLFFQISDGGTWYLSYWVHGSKLGVQGTWYMVSKVKGTWLRRY